MAGNEVRSLEGQTILLLGGKLASDEESAGFEPIDDNSPDEASTRLEEAVISLARAVFARGGRLAFWHDPVITPLVSDIALEYWVPAPAEDRFEQRGQDRSSVTVIGRPADWEHEWYESAVRVGHIQFSNELPWPRLRPARLICIGGTPIVLDHLDIALQHSRDRHISIFPTTGGVTRHLLEEFPMLTKDAETAVWNEIQRRRLRIFFKPPEGSDLLRDPDRMPEGTVVPEFRFALYPLAMRLILDGEDQDFQPE